MKRFNQEGLIVLLSVLCLTLTCGAFVCWYWVIAPNDPRNIFGPSLSDIGALVIFPVGYVAVLWQVLTGKSY